MEPFYTRPVECRWGKGIKELVGPFPPNRQTLKLIGFLLAVPALFQTSTTCLRLPEATILPERPAIK